MHKSWYIEVGVATRYVLDGSGFEPLWWGGASFSVPTKNVPDFHAAPFTIVTGAIWRG